MWWSARVHAQPKKLKDELSRVDNSPYHLIMDDCTRSNTKASLWELDVQCKNMTMVRDDLRKREVEVQQRFRSGKAKLELTHRGIERAAEIEERLEAEIRLTVQDDDDELKDLSHQLKTIVEQTEQVSERAAFAETEPRKSKLLKTHLVAEKAKMGLDDSVDVELSNLRSAKEVLEVEEATMLLQEKLELEHAAMLDAEHAKMQLEMDALEDERHSLEGSKNFIAALKKRGADERRVLTSGNKVEERDDTNAYMKSKVMKVMIAAELEKKVAFLRKHTEGFLGLCQRLSYEHVRVNPSYPHRRPRMNSGRQSEIHTEEHLDKLPPPVMLNTAEMEDLSRRRQKSKREAALQFRQNRRNAPPAHHHHHQPSSAESWLQDIGMTTSVKKKKTQMQGQTEQTQDEKEEENREEVARRNFGWGEDVSKPDGGDRKFQVEQLMQKLERVSDDDDEMSDDDDDEKSKGDEGRAFARDYVSSEVRNRSWELANRYITKLCSNATWEGRTGWERVVWGEDVNLWNKRVMPDTIHAPPRRVELLEEHMRNKEANMAAKNDERRCMSKVEFDDMVRWDPGRSKLTNIKWDDDGPTSCQDYRGQHRAAPPNAQGYPANTAPEPTNSVSQMRADLRRYGYCVLAPNVGVGSGPGDSTVPPIPFEKDAAPPITTSGNPCNRATPFRLGGGAGCFDSALFNSTSHQRPLHQFSIEHVKAMHESAIADNLNDPCMSSKWPSPPPRRKQASTEPQWINAGGKSHE